MATNRSAGCESYQVYLDARELGGLVRVGPAPRAVRRRAVAGVRAVARDAHRTGHLAGRCAPQSQLHRCRRQPVAGQVPGQGRPLRRRCLGAGGPQPRPTRRHLDVRGARHASDRPARTPSGWRLAPAYDVNPNPHKDAHGITVDGETTEPDLDAALACADLYRVSERRAKEVSAEVDAAIAGWRDEAAIQGLGRIEGAGMERVIAS